MRRGATIGAGAVLIGACTNKAVFRVDRGEIGVARCAHIATSLNDSLTAPLLSVEPLLMRHALSRGYKQHFVDGIIILLVTTRVFDVMSCQTMMRGRPVD